MTKFLITFIDTVEHFNYDDRAQYEGSTNRCVFITKIDERGHFWFSTDRAAALLFNSKEEADEAVQNYYKTYGRTRNTLAVWPTQEA